MQKKEVLLLLTDQWNDWEASYTVANVNTTETYEVKTIAIDLSPKASMGGLRTEIDYSIGAYDHWDHLAILILPGGLSWSEHRYDEIAAFVGKVHERGIPVAAICGATIFLAKHGFLDSIRHTGDEWDYFQEMLEGEEGYRGHAHFAAEQLVNDQGFITANETAAVEFANEIFHILRIDTDTELDSWYDCFKNGMMR